MCGAMAGLLVSRCDYVAVGRAGNLFGQVHGLWRLFDSEVDRFATDSYRFLEAALPVYRVYPVQPEAHR